MIKFKLVYFLLVVGLFFSCANIVSPTGGAKDIEPPKVIATMPAHEAINYTRNEISLIFDEYIQLNNPAQQVIVSPPVGDISFRTKGKSIYIEIKDTLLANTTYTISFGEAIKDLNEGNILQNYRLVFSTGTEIDTLTFHGNVLQAYSGQPVAGATVMLYTDFKDSIVYNTRPYYISKTDASGNFNFTNLKEGAYKIIALQDKNSNYHFDPSEAIAFDLAPVTVSETSKSVTLHLFTETPKIKVKDIQSPGYGLITAALNTPLDSIDKITTVPDYAAFNINKSRDTISFWFSDPYMDSAQVILEGDTSTVRLRWLKADSTLIGKVLPKIFITNNLIGDSALSASEPLQILFHQPISHYDLSNMLLREGDSTVTFDINFEDSAKTALKISYPWKVGGDYTLEVPDSIFLTLYGMSNSKMVLRFEAGPAKEGGSLIIKAVLPDTTQQYLLQILAVRQESLYAQFLIDPSGQPLTIKDVPPGNYTIRIVKDANRNNQWDTGIYLKGIQPEEVISYPGTATVKANWETEIEIKP